MREKKYSTAPILALSMPWSAVPYPNADVDLSTVMGLDAVHHDGPSTIGIDTIYRSHGQIPESFLRGAGVPENFITFMKSPAGAALDFYSCFISYSTRDQEFAERLYADLQETLAGIVGTTRSRVDVFMNRFRELGFIEYNGGMNNPEFVAERRSARLEVFGHPGTPVFLGEIGYRGIRAAPL